MGYQRLLMGILIVSERKSNIVASKSNLKPLPPKWGNMSRQHFCTSLEPTADLLIASNRRFVTSVNPGKGKR
jgi:hypothetical protein